MTKKTASRATKRRVTSKSKLKTAKTKTKKARKITRRTKSAAKAANPPKVTSSVAAWPGLPPGYFQRAR